MHSRPVKSFLICMHTLWYNNNFLVCITLELSRLIIDSSNLYIIVYSHCVMVNDSLHHLLIVERHPLTFYEIFV